MQRRKPLSPKHQARRRGALERLEARVARQKGGPDEKQLQEIASLRSSLQLVSDDARAAAWAASEQRRRDEDARYDLA